MKQIGKIQYVRTSDPSNYSLQLVGALSGKNRRLSSIFDSCWRNEVSNFCLRKFAKVGPFCEPNEPDVDINTENRLDNSGTNETMQKILISFDS